MISLNDLPKLTLNSIRDNEIAIVAFLDIEGTFNNVITNSIIETFRKKPYTKLSAANKSQLG